MVLSQMSKNLENLNISGDIDIYIAENESGMFNKIPLGRIVLVTEEDRKYLVLIGSKARGNYAYALQNTNPNPITLC